MCLYDTVWTLSHDDRFPSTFSCSAVFCIFFCRCFSIVETGTNGITWKLSYCTDIIWKLDFITCRNISVLLNNNRHKGNRLPVQWLLIEVARMIWRGLDSSRKWDMLRSEINIQPLEAVSTVLTSPYIDLIRSVQLLYCVYVMFEMTLRYMHLTGCLFLDCTDRNSHRYCNIEKGLFISFFCFLNTTVELTCSCLVIHITQMMCPLFTCWTWTYSIPYTLAVKHATFENCSCHDVFVFNVVLFLSSVSEPFNESAHKAKQMLPGGSKTISALQAGYFDEKFARVMEGEAYTDPVKRRRQERLKESSKNIGKAFLPSSGDKKP